MKNILKCLLLFSLFFSLENMAQKPGDTKVLSDNSTYKGRVELRKEKRVQHRKEKMDKKNERKARRKNSAGGLPEKSVRTKKNSKEKRKAKPVEEKTTNTTK